MTARARHIGGRRALAVALLSSGVACALTVRPERSRAPTPSPGADALPAADPALEPPAARTSPLLPFPQIERRRLDNGLVLRVIERGDRPLLELRLVVRSGTATDGSQPGLAALSGLMLEAGGAGRHGPRELVERIEALGTELGIAVGRDATVIGLNVTTEDLGAALAILSALALEPMFTPSEFDKLRAREIERVKSAERGDAAWAASMALYRQLYDVPGGTHPYAHYDALPEELAAIELEDCRRWYRAHFVPSNASLVVAGDISADRLLEAANSRFSAWSGEPAPQPEFPLPLPLREPRVFIHDRPGSAQAHILIGSLGPGLHDPSRAALGVADQILGGGVAGRLFLDVREQRSLAYATGSRIVEVAHGPMPLVVSAATRTESTPRAVGALLTNLAKISSAPPSAEEVGGAKAFEIDSFLLSLETLGSIATLTADLDVLGLSDEYYDEHRGRVRALGRDDIARAASQHYGTPPIIVVAGDAASLAPELTGYGRVSVLDADLGAHPYASGVSRALPAVAPSD